MIGHIGDRVDFWTRAKLWRSGKINDIMVNKLAGVTQYLVTDDNGYNHYVSEWNVRLPGSMNPPFGAYSAESMFERDAEKINRFIGKGFKVLTNLGLNPGNDPNKQN